MTQPAAGSLSSFERWGWLVVGGLLMLAFVTGGGASDHGIGDALTQLLALPLLVWAALALYGSGGSRLQWSAVGVAALVVLTVALQLLALPEAWSSGPAARLALSADLQAAGVTEPRQRWSLSPMATEMGLWSMLPALAVFVGALAMPPERQPRLLLLVVALATTSLVLGYLQLGAPQDSLLNPFPQWAPSLNGFFANPNHQATSLGIALVAIAALLLNDLGRAEPLLPRWIRFGLGGLGVLLFASLLLTGSRAMFLLAVLGLVAVPLLLRSGRRREGWLAARFWIVRLVLAAVAVSVVVAAIGWLRFDLVEEVRATVAKVTVAMGAAHAPWGAGVGSFVPWFDQSAPAPLVQSEYFNHAHNEYAQWWLESGVLGVLSALAVLALLAASYPLRAGRAGDRGVAVAAWLGCVLVLLHSLVDYPLRAPALMSVAALLAGIAIAQRAQGRPQQKGRADGRPYNARLPGEHHAVTTTELP